MEILRTDGGGRSTSDERLERFRRILKSLNIPVIAKIHDHKGDLTVYWLDKPMKEHIDLVDLLWELEFEYNTCHKILNPENLVIC